MSDLAYYDSNIPCLAACPVNTNAGAYVAAIADGDDLGAYMFARMPNPFASVCGRICAAPCEDACRRGSIDEPIAIRSLKRFVTEKYGVEAGPASAWASGAGPPAEDRPQSVGIVGGGPAGLAAAHDLRKLGYPVSLYEATGVLGGMMVLGIPEYRLDRRLLRAEIQAVVDMGVDVHLNTRVGRDVTFDDLRDRHSAMFLALGATLGRGLDIPGAEADGVLRAIEFLLNINQGFHVDVGDRVVVIGGGDVAMDVARTALRADAYASLGDLGVLQAEGRAAMTEAVDVARIAIREGAREVTLVALEASEEMPASEFEIREALEEGIRIMHRRGPARILTADDRAVGLETVGVLSVFDEDGRFAPTFDEDDRQILEADTVILAIGQAVDLSAFDGTGPSISPRRTIQVDPDTLETSLPLVWAGGDAAHGPRSLIEAVADGRKVGASIHTAFTGEAPAEVAGRMDTLYSFHRLRDTYDRRSRVEVPVLSTERRIGLREVELGFTEAQARAEAERCLRCFANILFDPSLCVLCALCSDVCPLDLIALVPSDLVGEDQPVGTALLLDESRCIRCALCIERCPTGALSMGVWSGVGVPA